ncbi:MAG: polymorphic toxin-type HINT domain-containing protein [bacterium]|nr:polymorphic toxin-type HINT domain-containing protein [bacterium]
MKFPAKWVALGIGAVIIVGAGAWYGLSGRNATDKEPDKPFIPVSPAYAEDNFALIPESRDNLGVDVDSSFILTSKEDITDVEVAESLNIEPALEFAVRETSANTFTLTPESPLTENEIYEFSISTTEAKSDDTAETDEEREYRWAYQVKEIVKVAGSLPRDTSTNVPVNSGIEVTFQNDAYYDFEEYFDISPEADGRFEKHKRTAVFVPSGLRPETLYTVTIKAGLPFEGSEETLAEDYVFRFETSNSQYSNDYEYFSFQESLFDFTSDREPVLEVYSYPSDRQREFVVYQFPGFDQFRDSFAEYSEYPAWAFYAQRNFTVPTEGLTEVARFTAAPQESNFRYFIVLPETLADGYYVINTVASDATVQSWIQVSNQASYLALSTTETLLWVNDVSAQGPVSGAKITSPGLSLDAETDTQGIAKFETPAELTSLSPERSHIFVVSSPTGKNTVVPASQPQPYYELGGTRLTEAYWKYVYVDRPIYSKTDTVKFWGLVKPRDGSPAPESVKAVLEGFAYDSYSGESVNIAQADVEVSDDATFIGEIAFSNLVPGYYTLKIAVAGEEIASSSVYVEKYVKPSYSINLDAEKKVIVQNENNTVNIRSEFFEGTSAPNVSMSYSSNSGSGEITTDTNGKAEIVLKSDLYDNVSSYNYLSVYSDSAISSDISSTLQYRVFPSDMWLAADTDVNGTAARLNLALNFLDLEAMNAEDFSIWEDVIVADPVQGKEIKGDIGEVKYDKIETGEYYDFINKVNHKTYRYERRLVPVDDFVVTTNQSGEALFEFEMGENASYEIGLNFSDNEGRTVTRSVYLWSGYRFYEYSADGFIHIENLDEDAVYGLGEEVRVALVTGETPLAENLDPNRYLFYQAGGGLRDHAVQTEPEYSFTFSGDNIPNTYLGGVWFDGAQYEATDYYNGEGDSVVTFDMAERQLDISVGTNQNRYAPGDEVTLTVSTTGPEGGPVPARVNLNLVDEAIYALRDSDVDPLAEVYKNVSSGILRTFVSHEKQRLESLGAEFGGCFLENTLVTLADGTKKEIEDVQPGEYILTRLSSEDPKLVPAKVSQRFEHTVNEYLTINDRLNITPNHILWVNGGWHPAETITVGDTLLDESGTEFVVTDISRHFGPVSVYNLHIEDQHTFFASGVYVHNDKAGARREFQDTVLFREIETGVAGQGSVSFTLPDNITSWRVTAQGVSSRLEVGSTTAQVPVSLPIFAESNLSDEYLAGDRPIVQVFAYGNGLGDGDSVTANLTIESLGYDTTEQGGAYQPIRFSLPELPVGRHDVYFTVEHDGAEDTVLKTIIVKEGYFETEQSNYYTLNGDVEIIGSENGQTTLVFLDKNRGYYYRDLLNLMYVWGDRVDQSYSRSLASGLLNQYFEENFEVANFDGGQFQTPEGGVALLPYASAELHLTALFADLAADQFDQTAMRAYLEGALANDNASLEEIVIALYGLASLDEPVLTILNQVIENNEIPDELSLYVALAMEKMGAAEYARTLYLGIINSYGEESQPDLRVVLGNDEDDYLKYSIMAAILANRLDSAEEAGLYSYIRERQGTDILINLENLLYLDSAIPDASGDPVSFTFTAGNRSENVTLEREERYALSLSPEELASIQFSNVSGSVGVISYFTAPISADDVNQDGLIGLERVYRTLNGTVTDQFSEGDLVHVTLRPYINGNAVDDSYQIVDFLPSGLSMVTRPFSRLQYGDYQTSWPYLVDGKKIGFRSWKGSSGLIEYYARVSSQGTFVADTPLIQGFRNKDSISISPRTTVNIE